MCTCFSYQNGDFYFGRNMDLEYHFGEQVIVVPRNMPLTFKATDPIDRHYAMIGMATVIDNYPLFAEAMNEKGLCMAGLNFEGYAHYTDTQITNGLNLTPYEIILWLLAKCNNVDEAVLQLAKLNIVAIPFTKQIPLPTLHWIIADKTKSIVLEATVAGIKIFDNPVGVLTNNPTFDFHLTNLRNYLHCTPKEPLKTQILDLALSPLGVGAGALGIPGDSSTTSRFIRTVFAKGYSKCAPTESANLSQVFHILDNVAMIRGNVLTHDGAYDITTYSSCSNADKGIYYYKTYENNQIQGVKMFQENLDSTTLVTFPLQTVQQIHYHNDSNLHAV